MNNISINKRLIPRGKINTPQKYYWNSWFTFKEIHIYYDARLCNGIIPDLSGPKIVYFIKMIKLYEHNSK